MNDLLTVSDMRVSYQLGSNLFQRGGSRQAEVLKGVSLTVRPNQIYGLVGESGSGKTTLVRAVIGLTRISHGSVVFLGSELRKSDGMCVNQPRIQMVFQDPNNSLDPRLTIRKILAEPILVSGSRPKKEIPELCVSLLESMELPADTMDRYPHQLSGGQRQRVGIARALSTNPKLIIADECTSALDVSVQAHVLNLLMNLRAESDVSFLFISHNLGVIHHIADYVAVMKDGQIVESGRPTDIFADPQQTYTQELLDSVPRFS